MQEYGLRSRCARVNISTYILYTPLFPGRTGHATVGIYTCVRACVCVSGDPPKREKNTNLCTLFDYAVWMRQYDIVEKLIHRGYPIDDEDNNGSTAMFLAVQIYDGGRMVGLFSTLAAELQFVLFFPVLFSLLLSYILGIYVCIWIVCRCV